MSVAKIRNNCEATLNSIKNKVSDLEDLHLTLAVCKK